MSGFAHITSEQRAIVERVANMVGSAAAQLKAGGVEQEMLAQGVWAAALQLGQDTIGLEPLIEWLRNTADALEDRLAAQLADRARLN